jgi:2-polyprenyl-6-methoxyphenol hydroxylase-like FAD-dependent oxidoreductase
MRDKLHVLIVGGGIGGLCLAQGLKKAGVAASVYERDQTAYSRLQGFRIHIDPDGSRALHECLPADLWEIFNSTGGDFSRGFTMLTEQLGELMKFLQPAEFAHSIERHRSVSRMTLRQVLLGGLGDTVHFDKRFERYEQSADGRIRVFFDDGSTAEGDVLVAADGVNSRIRKQYLPGNDPVETGVINLGGKVPLTDGVMALGGRPELFGLDVKTNLNALSPGEMRAILRNRMHDWHPNLRKLAEMIEEPGFMRIRSSRPAVAWTPSNITLLGDAIHSMTPYRGIGANVALRDAALLCSKLVQSRETNRPVDECIGEYEREMREYGFAAVAASQKALEQAVTPRNLGFKLAMAGMRAASRVPALRRRIAEARVTRPRKTLAQST